MPTALLMDPLFAQHDPGWNHPECPERYSAVARALRERGLQELMLCLTARPALEEDLLRCHSAEYINQVRQEIHGGMTQLSTGDTAVSYRSLEVAEYAAGSVLRAVDAVCGGESRNAFCLVRPPGHHATRDRGMGFCIYNNVAIGARYAQERYGLERVLIIDWDVHHGNGTQDIFYEDPGVFYFSAHESPLYPFTGWSHETGAGEGEGQTLNIALPAGAGGAEMMAAIEDELLPAMERFQPEMIFISAGFDAHEDDPIGHLCLSNEDFRRMTAQVMALAAKCAENRLVSVLEGGYNIRGLTEAVCVHVHELMNGLRE